MFKRCVLLSSLTLVACPAPAVFKCDPLTGQDCSGADGGLSSADGGSDAGRADGGPSADGGRIEVIGQRVSHFQGGTTRSPLDLTTFGLKVLTPESTFIEVSPVALDGGLAFEAIPEGIRYLRHGSSWTVGVNDRVDYTRHALGRPGIVVTDGGTRLRLAVSGLAPWVGQQLQLTAANANLFSFDTANFIQPSLGATSVTSDLDYVRLDTPAPLVDTSLGDVFTLAQFERTVLTTDGGTELYAHALARAGVITPLSVTDKATTSATVTLAPPSLQKRLQLPLARSTFGALAPEMVHKPRFPVTERLYLSAMPFTADVGEYASAPDLWFATANTGGAYEPSDLTLSASYRNPYPLTWPETIQYTTCFSSKALPIRADVSGEALETRACTGVSDLAAHAEAAGLTATVGPPRDLRIDGIEAMTAAGRPVNESFTVSWAAPTLGTPTGYRVSIRSTPFFATVASFSTTALSVRVPPGVLSRNQSYSVVVAAEVGVDRRATPEALTFPTLRTEVASGFVVIDDGQCARNNGGCALHATCTTGVTAPSCKCENGYEGSGTICTEINECAVNNGGCGSGSLCLDTVPGSECACDVGGCSARDWRYASPDSTGNSQLVYDAARGKTLLFNSGTAPFSGGTWTWDGATWTLASRSGPTPHWPSLAYDSVRQRVVMLADRFGTWEWNGTRWDQKSVDGFSWAKLAFDDHLGRMLAYSEGELSVWDGSSWSAIDSDAPELHGATVAYDSARQRLVVSGFQNNELKRGETWEYDGSTWERRASSAEDFTTLFYDVARARVMRMGNGTPRAQWTGTQWLAIGPSPLPLWGTVAYDSMRGCTVALRYNGVSEECTGAWVEKTSAPFSQAGSVAVTDPVRERVVLFNSEGPWVWNGHWAKSITAAPNILLPSFTFDSTRSVFVAVGVTPDQSKYETWEWDGVASTFTKKSSTGPLPGDGHAIAYDPVRNQTVLFGGVQFSGVTWLWSGAAWSSPTVSGPPARAGHSMVYEPIGQRIILAGGSRAGIFFDDTWAWNGSAWTRIVDHVPTELGAGTIVSMAYDPNHGGVVAPTVSGTWLLTGTQWSKLDDTSIRGALAYDPVGKSLFSYSNSTAWWF